jgi:hypothetical protein
MKEEHSATVRLLAAIRLAPWLRCLSSYTQETLKRHPLTCVGLGLMLALATLTIGVLAQRSSAAAPDQLAGAIALFQQGEVRLVQAMFAAIRGWWEIH